VNRTTFDAEEEAHAAARGRRRCVISGRGWGSNGQREDAPRGQPAVLFLSRHLSRKAARIDAEIDERVNDGSADERGDDNYQHFQAEGTHTGSPLKKGAIGQKRRFHENTPALHLSGWGWRSAGRRGNVSTAAPSALCVPC
jgi:hypothetical protein